MNRYRERLSERERERARERERWIRLRGFSRHRRITIYNEKGGSKVVVVVAGFSGLCRVDAMNTNCKFFHNTNFLSKDFN